MVTDIRTRLDEYRLQQRDLQWTGTFDEYFDIVTKTPQAAQLAHARVYDMIMSAGPSVMSKNCSDGGYLVQFRNDSTVNTAECCTDQGVGLP